MTPTGDGLVEKPISIGSSFVVNSNVMIVAVVVLFGVVVFILGLHIYAKWFWRHRAHNGRGRGRGVVGRRRRRRLEFVAEWPGHPNYTTKVAAATGLEKSILDQLPTFTYSDKYLNDGLVVECAVCLEEFSQGEECRFLPKCSHSFHIDCIDMWFHSHTTCPLCRCSVVSPEIPPPSTVQQEQPRSSVNGNVDVHFPLPDIVLYISNSRAGVTSVSGDSFHGQERAATPTMTVLAIF
ncbi:hypothetical protein R1flu_011595 [Riccia fluitans]|uniref:RING-type E3 ubiquitin transferase n=1 Tax=Riccia fluitans TaxID=41844 RepID=A0ABD1Z888_9MARC